LCLEEELTENPERLEAVIDLIKIFII
jgi:hypothetical protein